MRRRPLATRRQVLTAAGALAALPVATASRAQAATPTPVATKGTAGEAECLADLVRTGAVTRADFMAR